MPSDTIKFYKSSAIKIMSFFLINLVVSCSTKTPDFEAIKTNTPTPKSVLQSTEIPLALQTPSLTTPVTPTISPSALPAGENWNFKLAYVTFQDDYKTTKLWVLEPPYQTPHLILSPEPSNALLDYIVAWSHDGNKIAYTHLKNGKTIAVSIVDMSNQEQKQFSFSVPSEPFGSGSSAQISVYPENWSGNDEWFYIFALYIRPDKTDFTKGIFINTTSDKFIELDKNVEFITWSPVISDQFLYTTSLNSDNQMIHVGEVGHTEPVTTISKPKAHAVQPGVGAAWSPDGTKAILSFYDTATAQDRIALIDFQQATWTTLPQRGLYIPSFWSPNNQWVALDNRDLFFWSANKPKEDLIRIKAKGDFIDPKAWTSDGSMFVYQDGNTLYAVNPSMPQDIVEVLDLSALKIENDDPLTTLNIWMSPHT